ncbi:hypothetical protein N7448_007323 [Penicillium atrosanguineum]|uniref:SWR1-complex protein 5 n=1 Tax=Penicillium atrosanguineum TaxID=1132637 RepID=A0A9W9QE46_9EURO|nr:hypothetical protein N7448_007323 [Penicillium atrosanguineum]KAJ5331935.1 hypothetical protein N7476_001718 [Penicillium atrosanguineum]
MPADPVNSVDLDDELYESAEDEDFQLDGAQDDSDLSDSDNETAETAEPAKKKRKTDKKAEIPEDELDSGDEVTINKAREKRRKRKGKKGKDDEDDFDLDDDEGGAGGFVRTRAMKAQIHEEQRKPLAKIDGATIDVDSLWEQMNAPEAQMGLTPLQTQAQAQAQQENAPAPEPAKTNTKDPSPPKPDDNARHGQYEQQMVKIKRTYKFAGEMITEEKTVPKDSAEAKAFLSSGENVELTEVDGVPSRYLRRPLRKISRFDPNPTGTIKKSWEKQVVEGDKEASGPKINTVEKSRLDWAQYVDEAGIKDELRTASKAKEGYIGRMDFLGRVDAKRDEEARQARLKGI